MTRNELERLSWTSVVSSNIARVAHMSASRVLYVEFTSGQVYRYRDVSPDLVDELLKAPSVGSFFNRRVKASRYGMPVGVEE